MRLKTSVSDQVPSPGFQTHDRATEVGAGVLHAWVTADCSLLLTRYIPRPCSRLLHVTPRPHNPTSLAKHERAAAAPTTVMLSLALLTADLPARAVVTCGYRDRTAVCCVSVMEFNRKNISHVLVAIVRARQGTMWLCALSAEWRRENVQSDTILWVPFLLSGLQP